MNLYIPLSGKKKGKGKNIPEVKNVLGGRLTERVTTNHLFRISRAGKIQQGSGLETKREICKRECQKED